jgi:CTP:molybdopterin cytidylyltransferase MocA
MNALRTVAVILAAGGGSRFDPERPGAKLLAPWRGRPVAAWAVAHALAAGLDETWVVTGAADLSGVLPATAQLRALPNPDWPQGQATSLAVAIVAARARPSIEAVVVGLADQPDVGPEAWAAVAASSSPIAVATYGGRRRNPVRLAREVWGLLPLRGDEGARVVMRDRPDLVSEVPCQGNPGDIDTVEDLRGWN